MIQFLQQFGPVLLILGLFIALIVGSVLLVLRSIEYQHRHDEVGLFVGCILFMGWVFLLFIFLVFGLAFFLLPFIIAYFFLQSLRAKQQGFLWMLAMAAEKKIPLAPAVEAYAEEVGGYFGNRADEFAILLNDGVPLPEAIRRVPLLVARQHLPIICTAFEGGTLEKGLREAASAQEARQDLWGSLAAKFLYIAFMLWTGTGVLTFVMIKIVPAYEKIFKDFGTHLPPITIHLMGVSRWFLNYWYVGFPLYVIFLVLCGYSLMKYLGVAFFELPGVGWLMRRKHTAAIMDSLAMTVEQRRTIDAGVRTLSQTYPSGSVRVKLSLALAEILSGAPWGESLRRRGLIRQSDAAVLLAAERAGNLSWALRELADSNRRRLTNRLSVLVQTMFPPVVLCFGAMVMFIVVALFMPLIALIRSMS
jgi:type II secretory pathway component PulF